ncbi:MULTISPECIES: DUF308 domain-containing protein [Pseudobutyrivibrio]|uniref:Uncharacterized membrane protein HdeD, DUF308 family n=1 Tax=Pseudobutyrivibrio xylanivorans TaxID=185007 RepID=A0A1G5RW48_PSEXY|nr:MULTISPECIES: DUF308 domain-containing protein [Pseudobutyrivibrio]MDC7278309.1 DUF308 domain-containing protein [Butyrivibrio fibrisolvens]SCZ78276.1 Uncharacterized membrane protein HdeD, DUF308 family [Pseudobutyrivibrio xylanivorans]
MARNNEEIKDSKVALVAHIVASLVYLALGICLLVLDANVISQIAYSFSVLAVGILFICFGAWYMIKYFFNHEYIKISNYGFTMGVILVIIGAISIFQANYISAFIDALVCLIGVVLGAVMLQQSFALFHIQRGAWFLSLFFGIISIAASIYFLLVPQKFFERNVITCSYLIAIGALSLLSLLLMAIGLHDHKKDSNRNYTRILEDAPGSSLDDSIFEEDQDNYFDDVYKDSSSDLFED